MEGPAHLHAIILAGGWGTRLWPLSTREHPKQFLDVVGNGRTMLQETVNLLDNLVPIERIIVVTGKSYAELVRSQLPELPPENLIVEPKPLNTAPAMAVGAALIRARDPEAVVVNLPSDHFVARTDIFQNVVAVAATAAARQPIFVVAGAPPTTASTGFGYVEPGEVVVSSASISIHRALSFTEKPPPDLARSFLASGRYLWNANYYTFHVRTFEAALENYLPGLSGLGWPTGNVTTFLDDVYASAPAISIDHAMTHLLTNLYVVPTSFGWNDLGDWDQVYSLLATQSADTASNVVLASDGRLIVTVGSAGNLVIQTVARPVGLAGITDSIIVDTADALLVARRKDAQHVREIAAKLAAILGLQQ